MIYFITDTHEDGKSLKLSKKHIKKTIKQLTLLNSSDTLIHLGDVEEGKPLIS
jgi:predicted phosphodiesterase